MRTRAAVSVLAFSAGLMAAGSGLAQVQPLSIVLEPQAVTVSNATARGTVVLVAVGKQYEALYLTRRLWRESITDDDGNGVVSLPVSPAVPEQSVWVAVDLGSGRSVMAAGPQAGERIEAPLIAARRLAGAVVALRDQRQQVYAILVKTLLQPAIGPLIVPGAAWFLRAVDGGVQDTDGAQDGSIELSVASGQALGASTPAVVPLAVGLADRIYVIDPDTLDHYSALLAELGDIP